MHQTLFLHLNTQETSFRGESPPTSQVNYSLLILVWEDDGVGVPAADKDQISERGFGKDNGLGLFLVHEILSITGMTIRETGIEGQGARFEIIVPKGVYRFSKD